MKRLYSLLPVALLALGCSEYDVIGDPPPAGEPNPPGVAAEIRTDAVVQTTVASVDVLWVVDTSCSMMEEQTQLGENFDDFMTWFLDSGLDYHIGVVTTNMDDPSMSGRLQAGGAAGEYLYIDPLTPDPIEVFETMAVLGTDSHYNERGRDAVFAALDAVTGLGGTDNAGFYREDASLAVIVISDEDDYSTISLSEFENWLTGLKPDPEMLSFSSIVGEQVGTSTYSTCSGATEPGHDYLSLTDDVGGVAWSICDEDWSLALDQLGMEAAGLRREFFLTDLPVEDSLRVWVEFEGEVVRELVPDEEFEYNRARNSILLLDYVPEPLHQVFIEYAVLSTAYPEDPDAN